MTPMLNRLQSHAAALLVMIAAFLASAAILRQPAIKAQPQLMDLKLAEFESRRDEWNVLFVGTSSTYRSVNPTVVNASAARRGQHVDSYNFGMPAHSLPEMQVVLREIMEMKPTALKMVVLEPGPRLLTNGDNWKSVRAVRFHSPENLLPGLKHSWRISETWKWGLNETRKRIGSTGYNLTNTGMLASRFIRNDRQGENWEAIEDGYLSSENDPSHGRIAVHEAFMTYRDLYAEALLKGKRHGGGDPDSKLPHGVGDTLNDIVSFCAKNEIKLVLMIRPTLKEPRYATQIVDWMKTSGTSQRVLNFSPLDSAPEIYDLDLWYDQNHLNEQGAAIFSERLGNEIAAILSEADAK